MTSDLERRIAEHKAGIDPNAFTSRYNIKQLVYIEHFAAMQTAIAREKQLKRWSRIKKIQRIVAANPDWRDLSLEWGMPVEPFSNQQTPSPPTETPAIPPPRAPTRSPHPSPAAPPGAPPPRAP